MIGWRRIGALCAVLAMAMGTSLPLSSFAQGSSAAAMPPMDPAARSRGSETEVRLLVVADQESAMSAPAAARVSAVDVRLGDTVVAGRPLVRFECNEVEARREAALAEAQGARLQYEAKLRLQGLQSAAEIEVALAAAAVDRAQAAGGDARAWRGLGDRLGEAYQVADDIRDVLSDPAVLGKPIGQDAALGRPSAAHQLGLGGAIRHFESLVQGAIDAIPACAGAPRLRALVRMESERLVPKSMCEDAARRVAA
jgi:hypothetical protein